MLFEMPKEFSKQHNFPDEKKVMVDPSLQLTIRNREILVRELSLFLQGKVKFYSTKCLDHVVKGALGRRGLISNRTVARCYHSESLLGHLECLRKSFAEYNSSSYVWAAKENLTYFDDTAGLPVITANAEGVYFYCPPSAHQKKYAWETQLCEKIRHRSDERKDLSTIHNNKSRGKKVGGR